MAGAEGAMAAMSLDGNGKATPLTGTNEGNASLLKLEELGEAYALYQHAEATTIEEQAAHVGHLPGMLTKNLLLRVRLLACLGGTEWLWVRTYVCVCMCACADRIRPTDQPMRCRTRRSGRSW